MPMYEHKVNVQNSTNIINKMATQAGTVPVERKHTLLV